MSQPMPESFSTVSMMCGLIQPLSECLLVMKNTLPHKTFYSTGRQLWL